MTEDEYQLFVRKVKFSPYKGDCWIWEGAVDTRGYGTFWLGKKVERTHRLFWEHWNGPIPSGLLILHGEYCVKTCVRPSHLRLGTHSDNLKDAYQWGERQRV